MKINTNSKYYDCKFVNDVIRCNDANDNHIEISGIPQVEENNSTCTINVDRNENSRQLEPISNVTSLDNCKLNNEQYSDVTIYNCRSKNNTCDINGYRWNGCQISKNKLSCNEGNLKLDLSSDQKQYLYSKLMDYENADNG